MDDPGLRRALPTAALCLLLACNHSSSSTPGSGGAGGGGGSATGAGGSADGGAGAGGSATGAGGSAGQAGGTGGVATAGWSPPFRVGDAGIAVTLLDGAANAQVITVPRFATTGSFTDRSWSPTGGWQAPQTLFACEECFSPRGAMNANGRGVLAWVTRDPDSSMVNYARARRFSGQWEASTQDVRISSSASLSLGPVVVAATGTAHVFTEAVSSQQFLDYQAEPTGAWQTLNQTFTAITGTNVVFDQVGNGMLIYGDSTREVFAARFVASPPAWQPAATITSAFFYSPRPPLAVSADGTIMMGGQLSTELIYWLYSPATGWTYQSSPGFPIGGGYQDLNLIADGNDVLAVFTENDVNMPQILWSTRYSGGSFAPQLTKVPGSHAVSGGTLRFGIDGRGNITLMWLESSQANPINMVAQRYDKATNQWSAPVPIVQNVTDSFDQYDLFVSAAGPAVITWVNPQSGTFAATFQ